MSADDWPEGMFSRVQAAIASVPPAPDASGTVHRGQ